MLVYLIFALVIFGQIQENFGMALLNNTQILIECMKENALKLDETKKVRIAELYNLNNCAMKCFYTRLGVIKEDGTCDVDRVVDGLKKFFIIDDDLPACLKGIGKIEECNDMQKLDGCLKKSA